ncbi:MAG: hypothetical protein DVB23_001582 [Verrucomicrobia bacterium]|nr:MAG: hypothetical protein DVB23_001582 [Verrucomicrobiota bacterium]
MDAVGSSGPADGEGRGGLPPDFALGQRIEAVEFREVEGLRPAHPGGAAFAEENFSVHLQTIGGDLEACTGRLQKRFLCRPQPEQRPCPASGRERQDPELFAGAADGRQEILQAGFRGDFLEVDPHLAVRREGHERLVAAVGDVEVQGRARAE